MHMIQQCTEFAIHVFWLPRQKRLANSVEAKEPVTYLERKNVVQRVVGLQQHIWRKMLWFQAPIELKLN